MRYFDASALVKRYVREHGSTRVGRWLAADTPATSRLSYVELASAFARRAREGSFSIAERDRVLGALDADFAGLIVVEVTPAVAERARALVLRHVLRASDALQLASGLYLQEELGEAVPFAAFDARLSAAARREGLRVL